MYFIVSLPRCGTAWLANFLTWRDSFCYHEGVYGYDDFNDYLNMMDNNTTEHVGDCDTGLTLLLPWLYKTYPNAKYVFIQRDIEDIKKSLIRIGLSTGVLKEALRRMDWGLQVMNPLVVQFENLFTDTRRIWDYIGLTDFPEERHAMLRDMKMDDSARYTSLVNFSALMRSTA
jgi:hypothetical protein